MAVSHRFPVLVWQDGQGQFTARPADRDEPVGVGPSARLALEQVQDYLTWLYQQEPTLEGPGFDEPTLQWFRVAVRPEYVIGGQRYPGDEVVTLRLPAVRGRQPFGLRLCSLPTLGLRFLHREQER